MKDNLKSAPSARRYSDDVKEFALTLYFYSPKSYRYVRSIIPLPNLSLILKWSSTIKCEPAFVPKHLPLYPMQFTVLLTKSLLYAMSIRKQTIWNQEKYQYSWFIEHGEAIPDTSGKLASGALVFLLVGTRSRWKCPIGLKVWSITTDGTPVNPSNFQLLGCQFGTTYEPMVTKFLHPTTDGDIYAILDPCHILKLAWNALAKIGSVIDNDIEKSNGNIFDTCKEFKRKRIEATRNKFSSIHLNFEKHKMNVRLAAQTLSSSVADAIDFLNVSMNCPSFITAVVLLNS